MALPRVFQIALIAGILVATTNTAIAGVCDYRLSDLLRWDKIDKGSHTGKAIATAETGTMALGAAGITFKGLGYYSIVHATSGAAMIGSTAAGSSAAGTVGIIAGTSGVLGTAGAIVSAPATLLAAGATAVATTGLEVGCYFFDDRITDAAEVELILDEIARKDPSFELQTVTVVPFWSDPYDARALVLRNNQTGEPESFLVEDLYIVNGILMHSDWGLNSEIGVISASIFSGSE